MKSVKIAISAIAGAETTMHIAYLKSNLVAHTSVTEVIDRMAISTIDGLKIICLADVLYVKAEGNYSMIHMVGGKQQLVSKTLKHFADKLLVLQFIKSHQSYLVNCAHVLEVSIKKSLAIKLSSNINIPLSRRRASYFKNHLINQYSI